MGSINWVLSSQTHHQCPHLIFVIVVFDLRILGFGFGFFVFAVRSPLGLRSKDLGLGFLLWLWWFEAWAVVELVCLDFLVEVVVLVEGCWWVWIFDSFGFFGGGCGCVEGCWWWRS